MGNVCCGGGNSEMLARQELLKEGNDFKKKSSFLGVLSRTENDANEPELRIHDGRLMWRQTPGPSTSEDLPIHRIGKVCPMGRLDLILLGQNGQKLLELTAGATSVRDLWVQTLEELCLPDQAEQSEAGVRSNLNEKLEKQKEKQKEQYWKDRTEELEQRRLDAEERKRKIGVVGMKYTAQAMARR